MPKKLKKTNDFFTAKPVTAYLPAKKVLKGLHYP
jgi:hypothetical protein